MGSKTIEPADGDNSRFTLPSDEADAIRWVLDQYISLTNKRAWNAESLTALIKDAKEKGQNPGAVRLAIKLDKMSPEKRDRWKEEVCAAGALFGIVADYTEDEDKKSPIWGVIEKAKFFAGERNSIGTDIKELLAAAKVKGLDVPKIKLLAKLKHATDKGFGNEAEEWFAALDSYGAKAGLW